MIGVSLLIFIEKLKAEIFRLTEDYSSQLLKKPIDLTKDDDIKVVIKYINEKDPEHEYPEEYVNEFLKRKNEIELNHLINIFTSILASDKKNPNLTQFEFKLIKSSLLELKAFRNLFSHGFNVTNELLQRFFENVYNIFYYIKLPSLNVDRFLEDKSFLDEITFYLQNALVVNLKNENSFKFDHSEIQKQLEKNSKETEFKLPDYMETQKYFMQLDKELDKIFSKEIKQEIHFSNTNNIQFSENNSAYKFFTEKSDYLNYEEYNISKNLTNSISNNSRVNNSKNTNLINLSKINNNTNKNISINSMSRNLNQSKNFIENYSQEHENEDKLRSFKKKTIGSGLVSPAISFHSINLNEDFDNKTINYRSHISEGDL